MTVEEQLRAVSADLARARAAAGLGVRQLARTAGVSPGTVRNLEAGVREPGFRQAARVAHALDLRLELAPDGGAGAARRRPTPFHEIRLPARHFFDERPPLGEGRPARHEAADRFAWMSLHVIAAQVWWVRQAAGWSSEATAERWGLSPKTLRRLQYGEDWPSLRALAAVATGCRARVVLAPALGPWRPMPW